MTSKCIIKTDKSSMSKKKSMRSGEWQALGSPSGTPSHIKIFEGCDWRASKRAYNIFIIYKIQLIYLKGKKKLKHCGNDNSSVVY
jgi:hypothetical protein